MQEKSLKEHYSIGKTLSEGTFTKTFLAIHNETQQSVVIKALYFREMEKWKPFELFERESQVLQNLDHPKIPKLVEFFNEKEDQQEVFYLVTEQIQGESLAQKLESGWRPSDEECLSIGKQLLDILDYIHNLNPPVIHRDIKPSNIIINEEGQVHLVDFGGVQQHLNPKGSSTVVGTFGYMAPEHFSGQSVPASDLYSLGATLIHLLSGKSPAELPQKDLTLDFKGYINCSSTLKDWLTKMIKPEVEKRFESAEQALESLNNPSNSLITKKLPENSSIQVFRDDSNLKVLLPAIGKSPTKKANMTLLMPAALMMLYTLYSTWAIFSAEMYVDGVIWPLTYTLSFFTSIFLLIVWFLNFPKHFTLEMNPLTYKLTNNFPGQNTHQVSATGHTKDIVKVEHRGNAIFMDRARLGMGYSEEELAGLQGELLDYLLSFYNEGEGQALLEASQIQPIQLPPKAMITETPELPESKDSKAALSTNEHMELPPKNEVVQLPPEPHAEELPIQTKSPRETLKHFPPKELD